MLPLPAQAAGSGQDGGASPQVTLAGAELVHLADRYRSGLPKVRHQAPLPEGRTWVHEVIVDAARLAGGPTYPARVNGRCGSCAFRAQCPAHAPAAPVASREATP